MSITDPIADMLTRIRNGSSSYHRVVEMPISKTKQELARILKEEGYIEDFKVIDKNNHPELKVELRYGPNKERAITGIKRISRPGLRVYVKKDEVPKVLRGLGVAIISTSKGFMVDNKAREFGVGGEVVCYIW